MGRNGLWASIYLLVHAYLATIIPSEMVLTYRNNNVVCVEIIMNPKSDWARSPIEYNGKRIIKRTLRRQKYLSRCSQMTNLDKSFQARQSINARLLAE